MDPQTASEAEVPPLNLIASQRWPRLWGQ